MSSILDLSDDVLRHVVRLGLVDYLEQHRFARSCRRACEAVRAETTLWVTLSSGTWDNQLVGFPAPPGVVGKRFSAQLHIDVREEFLPQFPPRLRHGLELLLLANRRSASSVGLSSLRLIDRQDLGTILPGLAFHLAMAPTLGGLLTNRVRTEAITSVTLVQCVLPCNLGLLLKRVKRLRLWECLLESSDPGAEAALVASLATLPLEDLVWAGGRHAAPPLGLLETAREGASALRRLAVGISHMELEELTIGVGGAGLGTPPEASWTAIAGTDLETLALLGHDPLPTAFAQSLLAALPLWRHSLRSLHCGADALISLCQYGGECFVQRLAPNLEHLGTIDCSWLSPLWFFDAVDLVEQSEQSAERCSGEPSRALGDTPLDAPSAAADTLAGPPVAAARPLGQLRSLSLFINSPGATASRGFDPSSAMAGCEQWPSAGFEPGCAMHAAAERVVGACPKLERLYVTWYEEDDVTAAGLATALAPLTYAPCLRELNLMRSGENCGVLVPPEGASTYETLARALPKLRVVVHDGPPLQALGTEQPLWELADSVDMLRDGALCHGLAPRYEPHNRAARE